ncbi:hypothetical protein [Deinococcus wulumuqiensis]|uniref:Uncharacterized protein n=2 Tax=Deinococcus wulumuqiensis TaxID=980427 RepID=A0AAV4K4Z0_9DEIO|nr:hypothetical protein [Deinococcus wulumuqiensis]QII19938.1 hypothetical protein G6R31_03580 [Deinococcus wulumuqiensis R12]GGI74334.1 hypothetical protein GCM10010914_05500 [Deinococcus wulumuqiensis]
MSNRDLIAKEIERSIEEIRGIPKLAAVRTFRITIMIHENGRLSAWYHKGLIRERFENDSDRSVEFSPLVSGDKIADFVRKYSSLFQKVSEETVSMGEPGKGAVLSPKGKAAIREIQVLAWEMEPDLYPVDPCCFYALDGYRERLRSQASLDEALKVATGIAEEYTSRFPNAVFDPYTVEECVRCIWHFNS